MFGNVGWLQEQGGDASRHSKVDDHTTHLGVLFYLIDNSLIGSLAF